MLAWGEVVGFDRAVRYAVPSGVDCREVSMVDDMLYVP
jgi:hypothetical protein